MDHTYHNRIVNFIWSIADDCLRDVFVRGKYRDVILPMFVLRRLDCLLEPTKEAVLEEVKFQREDADLPDLDPDGLKQASGYIFYNTPQFTLKSLLGNPSNLEQNFKTYIEGFSPNVKEIIENFDLANQVRKMVASDVLFDVIEKYVSEEINLSPNEVRKADGKILPALTNLGMGYVFEELIRKFNEENNEEAGEHFTPREVIKLMTHIIFDPIKNNLPPVLTIYDPACGSGGMLTESQNFIIDPEGYIKSTSDIYLYGKESQPETFAICKSDMMIKGNNPENIKLGSTLATDEFSHMRFDFMLSNPPYGKSWKSDQKYIKDGKEVIDSRFQVSLRNFFGEVEIVDATPRSSDGQLLFLMEMVNKMKSSNSNSIGSRIASVHNGSSLFTGDAGGGESNIRRYIIENDLLEAIIQLPNNLFYNTGITTYIWILNNNKAENRRGKIQLINASNYYQKLRKNLGEKNCELSDDHIDEITNIYLKAPQDKISKIFDNRDFGYHKVTIERPLRKAVKFSDDNIEKLRFIPNIKDVMAYIYEQYGDKVYKDLKDCRLQIEEYLEKEEISLKPAQKKSLFSPQSWQEQLDLMKQAEELQKIIGDDLWLNYNEFLIKFEKTIKNQKIKLSPKHKKQILDSISFIDENSAKVIKKIHKFSSKQLSDLIDKIGCSKDQLADYGYFKGKDEGEYIEYETDSNLRDFENIPVQENIHEFFIKEVRPYVDDAWIDISKTNIGYEISFNKHFYEAKPLRSLEVVTKEILEIESQSDGLLKKLVGLTDNLKFKGKS